MDARSLAVPFLILTASIAGATGGPKGAKPASILREVEPVYSLHEVRPTAGGREGFSITLRRTAPTAGWSARIENVEVIAGERIRIDLLERAPSGMVAQVLTPIDVSLAVEPLVVGRYVVEIRTRRSEDQPHRTIQAFVLQAGA